MKKQLSFLIEPSSIQDTASHLAKSFGMPEIRQELAIYISHSSSAEVSIKISNNSIQIRNNAPGKPDTSPPYITTTENLKQLIKVIAASGGNKGKIGEATCLSYVDTQEVALDLMLNTLIGSYIRLTFESDSSIDVIKGILSRYSELPWNKKSQLIENTNAPEEVLIDEIHLLNSKITEFCSRVGIIPSIVDNSIKGLLKVKSNDYSNYESLCSTLLNIDLLSRSPIIKDAMYTPVSLIVPFYNDSQNLEKYLMAIQSQRMTPEELRSTEVILIDDGSDTPLQESLDQLKRNFTFKIITLRINKNSGRAIARNLGASFASNEVLIFTDSDILLSKDYLKEHSIRNRIISNAVFVSFKQNIDQHNPTASIQNIANGLDCPEYYLDSRIQKHLDISVPGLYELRDSATVDVLSDTNYFKEFGFGRNLGIYDLPSMVAGHNLSCRRSTFKRIGGFSEEFKGWGMEDTYFGGKMIAEGNFVIPVLSCGAYHIDHPARSGSEKIKRAQLESNLDLYSKLITKINY